MMLWLFSVVFFLSGIIINSLQLLLYLFLKPLRKSWYRSVNYYLCYSLYSQIVFVAEWWSRTKVEIWIDEDDLKNYIGKEHGLVITNHSHEIDWIVCWIFAEKCNVLGNVKAFVNNVTTYTPIIRWAWKFADFIFLEDAMQEFKDSVGYFEKFISKQLDEVRSYSDPVWLALVPEGSRFTPEKQEESAKFALERGIPALKHHLIPRTKGFIKSLPSLRNNCVIYDLNIAFRKDEVMPTLLDIFNGNGIKAYMFMRRIAMNSIPENEEQAAQWLHELFREKDRILESFHTTGSFFQTSGFKEPKSFVTVRRWSTLLNFLAWTVVFTLPVVYYLVPLLIDRTWLGLLIPFSVPMLYYFLMHKVLRKSKFNTVSWYESEVRT